MQIDNLKHVSLGVEVNDSDGTGFQSEKKWMNLIFGVSSSGLCDFERALAGRSVGERITMKIASDEIQQAFGHHYATFNQTIALPLLPLRLTLTFSIDKIRQADDREIIRAMSSALSASGSGCSGDCNCGCSG